MFRLFLIISLLITAINVFAAAKVIAVVGKSRSVVPFLKVVSGTPYRAKQVSPKESLQKYFQVSTKSLTPGKVKTRKTAIKPLLKPIFIIGDDNASLYWLERYEGRLKKIGAIGFIVNLNGRKEYKALVAKYHLLLFPVNGDLLARKFNLHHYPVLISENLIEQ